VSASTPSLRPRFTTRSQRGRQSSLPINRSCGAEAKTRFSRAEWLLPGVGLRVAASGGDAVRIGERHLQANGVAAELLKTGIADGSRFPRTIKLELHRA